MNRAPTGSQFRFRKNENIGSADAESDEEFLFQCFVDTGDLDALRNNKSNQRLIVGRTGAGKSALIRMVADKEDHVIQLRPEDLSLGYLANSEVLKFFDDAGANLDVFYQLLWKHVIAVELIRRRYRITNENSQRSFFDILAGMLNHDKSKAKAIEYLQQWGTNFWNETEARVREVTEKIESSLRASVAGSAAGSKLEAGGVQSLTSEEKLDVVNRGAQAVNKIQVAALSNVLRILEDEIFTDPQEVYFVVIDDLDTHWVDDHLKYKLIRALIETTRAFKQVKQIKIVVALRLDLLQRVITATKDSGFQSEKYEPLQLNLRWTKEQLIELVNRRIDFLIKQRYTSKNMSIDDVFPPMIQKSKFKDYLCERTFLRPRDAILFINECLTRASERQQVTVQMVLDAEAAYSEKRMISLQEEWSAVFPKLSMYLQLLARKQATFPASEFSIAAYEDWAMTLLREPDAPDPVTRAAKAFFLEEKGSWFEVVLSIIDSLYVVGAIGVKPDAQSPTHWSYYSDHRPAAGSITPNSSVSVHPTFWRVLGVRGN